MTEIPPPSTETRTTRLKRLRLRSWRRGMKEMDLILGKFADEKMANLTDSELDTHEAMMDENDQDLYRWFSRQAAPPAKILPAIERLWEHF